MRSSLPTNKNGHTSRIRGHVQQNRPLLQFPHSLLYFRTFPPKTDRVIVNFFFISKRFEFLMTIFRLFLEIYKNKKKKKNGARKEKGHAKKEVDKRVRQAEETKICCTRERTNRKKNWKTENIERASNRKREKKKIHLHARVIM